MAAAKTCDIVLEGGGVRGLGLVGALKELDAAGYTPYRAAGTSAGAIVGALMAAGIPVKRLVEIMETVDYRNFRDGSFLSKFGWPGEGLSLILTKGIYRGEYLRKWLTGHLAAAGIRTFGDLRLTDDWALANIPPERRYKLVVIVSDVSRGRLVRLPWDYAQYGLDPDEQLVTDAVRASMAIPFFYEPSILSDRYLVDGGILSNFPIEIFDDAADWPTFGIKLSAKEEALMAINPVTNPANYTTAILGTMTEAHDRMHLDEPSAIERTIFVDTLGIKATDFGINKDEQAALYKSGRTYARKFLDDWDFADYQKRFAKR